MITEQPTTELFIKNIDIQKGALTLRALNHKLRQQILRLIHQKQTITVTEIYEKLRIEQSVASQHLAILRKSGFVLTTRNGKFIYYSINYDRVAQVQELSQGIFK
jgi:DNA-binding transcriptional ArsR family regulator